MAPTNQRRTPGIAKALAYLNGLNAGQRNAPLRRLAQAADVSLVTMWKAAHAQSAGGEKRAGARIFCKVGSPGPRRCRRPRIYATGTGQDFILCARRSMRFVRSVRSAATVHATLSLMERRPPRNSKSAFSFSYRSSFQSIPACPYTRNTIRTSYKIWSANAVPMQCVWRYWAIACMVV